MSESFCSASWPQDIRFSVPSRLFAKVSQTVAKPVTYVGKLFKKEKCIKK
jgi:hypothetical protein